MEKRIYNFSAGPAVLPQSVLKKAQDELVCFPGSGMSVMEMSHRSPAFTKIIEGTEANLRKLLSIPDNYRVLFLQGGAQLQFAMAPMNILKEGQSADYILTGTWSKKAIAQAKTQKGNFRVAWDGAENNYSTLPSADQLDLDPEAAFVYYTGNETIQGVQFPTEPAAGDKLLICDSSSELLWKPVDIEKYGILYACAQKNVGPAGVTIVIIRDDLVELSDDGLPAMLSYKQLAAGGSMLNTPPCFAIYMVKLVTEWLLEEVGGLDAMYKLNAQKARLLYDVIDDSDGFYLGHAKPGCRSLMNVPFKMQTDELDKKFLAEAAERGLITLKGHRSVGGFRASIYNAMPIEGVELLAQLMQDFQKQNS
jgi:phosphoserine aminotransferase